MEKKKGIQCTVRIKTYPNALQAVVESGRTEWSYDCRKNNYTILIEDEYRTVDAATIMQFVVVKILEGMI